MDLIDRQAAIDAIRRDPMGGLNYERILSDMPTAQPEQKWIPVKMCPMDSEEREYWEDMLGEKLEDEDAVLFNCPMPEDGQEILVSYRNCVSTDICEIDGACYGLEGNGDWEGIIAWMPLPKPYEERRKDATKGHEG